MSYRRIPFSFAVMILYLIVSSVAAKSAYQPNLIFVLSDDIAQGDLGCYGQALIQTPRIDQLAAKAQAIFREAHRPDSNWPLTGPSAAHKKNAREAWDIKRSRDNNLWAPANAIELSR